MKYTVQIPIILPTALVTAIRRRYHRLRQRGRKPHKRLMFFFDGSSNRAAAPATVIPTNVFRLNQAFTYGFSGVPQITFYFAGVGTRGDPASAVTGRGFDETVIEAFVNLASNYTEGDSIYLFGFSRGAAAARALSELISYPGLASADALDAFPEVWRYFVSDKIRPAEREVLRNRLSGRVFDPSPKVEFLGAFDTVAGTSWDRANLFTKVRIRNLTLAKCVKAAVQILSIDDDRRPSFSPLLWKRNLEADQKSEQIWMPGVHADVGGLSDGRFLGNVALLTMIERIKNYCPELEWDKNYLETIFKYFGDPGPVEITNERPDFWRQLLFKGPRVVGMYANEYIHPIVEMLRGTSFRIKEKFSAYAPQNYAKNSLPFCHTQNLGLFWDACSKALRAGS